MRDVSRRKGCVANIQEGFMLKGSKEGGLHFIDDHLVEIVSSKFISSSFIWSNSFSLTNTEINFIIITTIIIIVINRTA